MSQTTVAEPPAKRQRADNEDNGNGEKEGEPKDDDEFLQLQAVSVVQEELNDLEEEEANAVLAVHKAFLKRKRPLYARRQEAISKVPNFWLKVLLAHPLTQLYVTGNDQYPLSYLEAISISKSTSGINLLAIQEQQERQKQQQEDGAVKSKGVVGEQESKIDKKPEVDDDDDGVGFRVTFTFRENPFFTNECLWKEWESMVAEQAMFSEVDWKDTEESRELQACLIWNMDPNNTEEKEPPSFFSIFCEDVEDYEFGEALRGEIIENPLDIYMRHDLDVTEEGADQEGFPPQEEAFAENGFAGIGYGEYPEEEGDLEQTGEEFHKAAREEEGDDDEGVNGDQQS